MGRQMNSAAFRASVAAAVLAGKPAPVRKLPKPVSKPARQPVQEHVDATPERIARASDEDGVRHDRVVDAMIDKAGERAKLTRKFADSWIDRMLARQQLTYSQWFACDWYATLHAAAHSAARVVADYGEGCGGAGRENYGQPLSARQWDARRRLRDARTAIPSNMATLFDQVVIEDAMPAFRNGQQRARFAARVAAVAQQLAITINAPGV